MRRLSWAFASACSIAWLIAMLPAIARASAFPIPAGAAMYSRQVIRDAHFYWGLRAPLEVFFAQIHQESRWRPDAQSIYAAGLTQFTPATAADIARLYSRDFADVCKVRGDCRLDPRWAIRAMVLYDRQLRRRYDGAAAEAEALAMMLAAYNGGAGWIDRERELCRESGACDSNSYFTGARRGVGWACGRSTPHRSAEACAENRGYPDVILHRWAPGYRNWLKVNAIE